MLSFNFHIYFTKRIIIRLVMVNALYFFIYATYTHAPWRRVKFLGSNLIWWLCPITISIPSFYARARYDEHSSPVLDFFSVYLEGFGMLMLLFYGLLHARPSAVPAHLTKEGDDDETVARHSRMYRMVKNPSGLLPRLISQHVYVSDRKDHPRDDNHWLNKLILWCSLMCGVIIYTFFLTIDFNQLKENKTVLSVDAKFLGMEISSGLEAGDALISTYRDISPIGLLLPPLAILSTIGSLCLCGKFRGKSLLRDSFHSPLKVATICLSLSFLLVSHTSGWSPFCNATIVTFKSFSQISSNHEFERVMPNSPEGLSNYDTHTNALMRQKYILNDVGRRRPNAILIVKNSLGGYLTDSAEGHQNMPFFHTKLSELDGFVKFRNSRGMSTLTPLAVSAILAGISPFDKESMFAAEKEVIGERFTNAGYEVGVFSNLELSYLDLWRVDCCEKVGDKKGLIRNVEDWLDRQKGQQRTSEESKKPFMMIIVVGEDDEKLSDGVNYATSTQEYDTMLHNVFDNLHRNNLMDNTIVVGASAHGDAAEYSMSDFRDDDPAMFQNTIWTYLPRDALLPRQRENMLATMRTNSNKLVTSVDVLPTLMSLMGALSEELYTNYEKYNLLHGESLALTVLPDDRAVYLWQGMPWSTNPPYGAVFLGINEGFFFGREDVVGIVRYPPQGLQTPPFPLLEKTVANTARSIYRSLISHAPSGYRQITEPYVTKHLSYWSVIFNDEGND